MATTNYGTNNSLAVKVWSKRLAVEALKATQIQRFIGKGTDALIQIKEELTKSAGDKITYGLRMQLSGAGVQGDGVLESNEEALTTYSDAILIDQLRHAVRSNGRVSQQRVPFSVRDEALSGLRDWWADRMDYSFFNQICGNTLVTDTRFTGMQSPIAPDANHYLNTASTTDDSGVSTAGTNNANVFQLSLIDRAKERAKTLSPAIRPFKIDGKDWYVMFLHPYQVTDLRTNTNPGQFLDLQKAAMTGGEITQNPIFTGALGVYNGVILHEDYRIPSGIASGASVPNARRAVFCGAQAAMLAYGQDNQPNKFTWVEELFDYENQLGVSAGCIFGLKKTVFNSADFATIVCSSYAVAH